MSWHVLFVSDCLTPITAVYLMGTDHHHYRELAEPLQQDLAAFVSESSTSVVSFPISAVTVILVATDLVIHERCEVSRILNETKS